MTKAYAYPLPICLFGCISKFSRINATTSNEKVIEEFGTFWRTNAKAISQKHSKRTAMSDERTIISMTFRWVFEYRAEQMNWAGPVVIAQRLPFSAHD